MFTESLKDPECVTIVVESHLQELSDVVDFITKKFDIYEKEIKEREEIINNLTKNVSRSRRKVDDLSAAVEKQEQYSKHNCLLLHGIPEKKQENTDKLCIKVINEHLDLAINNRDIDRTHCIGNPRNAGEKPRTIIIKLVRYNERKKIFDSKKKLKGKKITESLTVTLTKKLNEARETQF